MDVPESLGHKMDLFKANGRVFREQDELFAERSWAAVMLGQGVQPNGYHPFVDNMTDKELHDAMANIRVSIARMIEQTSSHQDFIEQYCGSSSLRA